MESETLLTEARQGDQRDGREMAREEENEKRESKRRRMDGGMDGRIGV